MDQISVGSHDGSWFGSSSEGSLQENLDHDTKRSSSEAPSSEGHSAGSPGGAAALLGPSPAETEGTRTLVLLQNWDGGGADSLVPPGGSRDTLR